MFWPVLRELHITQILVTHEVKVTLEHRRLSTYGGSTLIDDADDDAMELQRSKSGLQAHRSAGDYHYDDPYIAQQVNPFHTAERFGVTSGVQGAGPMVRMDGGGGRDA